MGCIVTRSGRGLALIGLLLLGSPALALPRVLVVHSWHDILWDRLWEQGLNSQLAARFELVRFDLDALRLAQPQLQQRVEQAWTQYQTLAPALVILGDDVALRELGPRLSDTQTPVVYLGINHNPRKYLSKTNGPHFTGIIERPLYERAIRQIAQLFPERSTRVLLLNDSQPGEEDVTDLMRIFGGNPSAKIQGLTIDLKVTRSWEQWQQWVLSSAEDGYDVLLFDSRYRLRNQAGTYVEPEAGVVRWMSQFSPLPLFSFYEDSVGPQLAVGGWVISGFDMGVAAGQLALELLEGSSPEQQRFPIFFDQATYLFSQTQLDRWQIRLPDAIRAQAQFAEHLHPAYQFDCASYSASICY